MVTDNADNAPRPARGARPPAAPPVPVRHVVLPRRPPWRRCDQGHQVFKFSNKGRSC